MRDRLKRRKYRYLASPKENNQSHVKKMIEFLTVFAENDSDLVRISCRCSLSAVIE
jgi:hypothetical protein